MKDGMKPPFPGDKPRGGGSQGLPAKKAALLSKNARRSDKLTP